LEGGTNRRGDFAVIRQGFCWVQGMAHVLEGEFIIANWDTRPDGGEGCIKVSLNSSGL